MKLEASQIVGSWRLLSAQLEIADTQERVDLFGPDPLGRAIFGSDGRMAVVLTASTRSAAPDAAGAAALFGSMMAFSGTYRVEEGPKVVFGCDMAWHPAWVGTEQVRSCELNGDRLTLRTGRQTHPSYPGKEVLGQMEWQREG